MLNRNPSIALFGALLFLGAAPFAAHTYMGGWAVTTVQDLPDYVVTGKPLTLAFTVRQHGRTPLNGLKPEIEARAGTAQLRATANPAKGDGQYQSTITLPHPGEWTITIHSGFMNSSVTLLPLRAVEPGAKMVALTDAERGQRLFLAKGCVTCHGQIAVGPDLTNRQFPAEYVKQILADPKAAFGSRRGATDMPNLNLSQQEIASLAAFVGSDKHAASR